MRSAFVLALALAADLPNPAAGQTTAELKARCAQLIAYYDYYGVGRRENSDGARNHTRIGADIDCKAGLYAEGIASMEDLLRRKKFTPPLPGEKGIWGG